MQPIDASPWQRKRAGRAPFVDRVTRAALPSPAAERRPAADLWREALAATPRPPGHVWQALERAASAPDQDLSEEALRALRALQPALALARRAVVAGGHDRPLPFGGRDLSKARQLAVAALLRARRELRGEAPALAEWGDVVALLGLSLGRGAAERDAWLGLSLNALGIAWVAATPLSREGDAPSTPSCASSPARVPPRQPLAHLRHEQLERQRRAAPARTRKRSAGNYLHYCAHVIDAGGAGVIESPSAGLWALSAAGESAPATARPARTEAA